jgi:hypothetical protein
MHVVDFSLCVKKLLEEYHFNVAAVTMALRFILKDNEPKQ